MTTTSSKMTIDRIREISDQVHARFEDAAKQAAFDKCGDWLKVNNDWQGWDSGVEIMTREELKEHDRLDGGAPKRFLAAVGANGFWTYLTTSSTEAEVEETVVACFDWDF
jgi:hypothetical protein